MTHVYHLVTLTALLMVLVFYQDGFGSSTSYPITNIDQKGMVTVTDLKSKQTFEFHVMDPKLLRTLKVGQLVYPDFQNQRVSLDGVNPCCPIVDPQKLQAPLQRKSLPKTMEPIGPAPDVKSSSPVELPKQGPGAPGLLPPR